MSSQPVMKLIVNSKSVQLLFSFDAFHEVAIIYDEK